MTARSSTGNFSKFGTYFLYKLRSMRSLIILNAIFALFSYPTALGILVPYGKISEQMETIKEQYDFEHSLYYTDSEYIRLEGLCDTLEGISVAAVVIGFIMLMLMFIMNYVLTAKSFRWLYDKTVVDMDYALPVSDDTRFFGDLLASLAGSLVPHLIAIIIGCILFRQIPFDGNYSNLTNSIFDQLVFTGFVSCIMFTALSLLIMSLCGRTAEARIYPFVLNAAIPIIHAVCMSIVLSNVYGYSNYGSIDEYMSVAFTSPLGLLGVTFMYGTYGEYDSSIIILGEVEAEPRILLPMLHLDVLIPLIILTLGCFVGAYFLIKYRRAERVGSPYVFNVVKVAIPAVVTFAITSCFSAFIFPAIKELGAAEAEGYSYSPRPEGFIIAWLISTFVLYVIMELISGKGFKKFYITLLKYAVTAAASFGICAALFYSNGMGIAHYVPNVNDVARVQIGAYNYYNYNGHLSGTVSSPEEIQKMVDFHRDIPKNGAEEGADNDYYFGITYAMKDGSKVRRDYPITAERYQQAVDTLFSSELYYSTIMPTELTDWINGEERYSNNKIIGVTVDNDEFYECAITPDELAEALRKDSESATVERVFGGADRGTTSAVLEFRHTDVSMYSSSSYDVLWLRVYPWYESTVALLESKGVTVHFDVDLSEYEGAFMVKYDLVDVDGSINEITNTDLGMLLYATGDYTIEEMERYGYDLSYYYEQYEDAEQAENAAAAELFGFSENMEVKAVPVNGSDIKELIEMSGNNFAGNYSSDTAYKLVLTNCTSMDMLHEYGASVDDFFIAEENLDRAAEIFDSLAA